MMHFHILTSPKSCATFAYNKQTEGGKENESSKKDDSEKERLSLDSPRFFSHQNPSPLLVDWLPILLGRPGNWALVLEVQEGSSYVGAYKSHTPKWAVPVGCEVYAPSAACFGYGGEKANVAGNNLWNVLPYGALIEWDTTNKRWFINRRATQYWTRYHDWRWWDVSNKQYVTEPIVSNSATAETMMRALRRVGVWFYIGHSVYFTRYFTHNNTRYSVVYSLFGKAIWGAEESYILDRNPTYAYSIYGSLPWSPSGGRQWFAISNLPDNDLSQLRLAVIVACAGAMGDLPQSYPLLDQIVAKGCPLALGLVASLPPIAETHRPQGVNVGFARKWTEYFWYYATKGTKDPIKVGEVVLQEGGRWDVLAAANKALIDAGGTKPRLGTSIYSGVIVVDGPWKRPYSVYFARQFHINPKNYYLSPAEGGKDDRALRLMSTSNLYP